MWHHAWIEQLSGTIIIPSHSHHLQWASYVVQCIVAQKGTTVIKDVVVIDGGGGGQIERVEATGHQCIITSITVIVDGRAITIIAA